MGIKRQEMVQTASKVLVSLATACLALPAAADKHAVLLVEDPCPPTLGFRIGVFDDGRLELNGSSISTSAFGRAIDSLTPETVICLYRDRPEGEYPPPNYGLVVNTLIKARPLRRTEFYWDPAFTRRMVYK
jgi:hypothetical protein